jgi:tetratricopeptide (TPR) repeat protein
MKKQSFQTLGLAFVTAVGLTACDGLAKLVKSADQITYKVIPEVMTIQGDSVTITIKGTYPAKVFPKKATVTTTPVIVYTGGEKALTPITLIGEQVQGKGTKITNSKGGSFSYTSTPKIAYLPEMKVATLELRTSGQVKTKVKQLPAKKVADGIITTPLLVKSDDKVILAKDNFQKVASSTKTASIFFLIDESRVLTSKLTPQIASMYHYKDGAVHVSSSNAEQLNAFKSFVVDAIAKGSVFKGITVSAYASPDGELTLNTKLAEERAANSIKELIKIFKDKKSRVDSATMEAFYTKVTTAEDWDGFKTAMEASSIPDKDLILRVLTMYPDGETREKEIKNLSATYTEVSEKILPQLRRSVLTLNIDEKCKTDEQLLKLATSHADSLTVEEILRAATLTEDLNTKTDIYKKAAQLFPNDWRTVNNLGYTYLLQNQIDDAAALFQKADTLKADNPIVKNNLGVIARKRGNRKEAMGLFSAATGAGSEVSYNMGILEIQNGNYAAAVTDFGDNNSFNSALAKLLNNGLDDAVTAIDNSNEKDAALSFYLKAIAGARKNSTEILISNLKTAIEKDASYKQMAIEDAEFIKFRDNADFKAAIN